MVYVALSLLLTWEGKNIKDRLAQYQVALQSDDQTKLRRKRILETRDDRPTDRYFRYVYVREIQSQ